MFILGKIKMLLILTVVIGAVGFGAWKYYQYTQEQIRIYAVNAATAELAQQQAEAAIESIKKDMVEIQAQFTAVSEEFAVAKGRVSKLEEKLSEHEIGNLAQKKPKLIEKIIDKGTADVLRCYEILTGSPLTEMRLLLLRNQKQIQPVQTWQTLTIGHNYD
tara:strand:+ start:2569 stop:3051 length:483 start_codon:yes stop_codon:yes gene_type:complete